MRPPQLTCTAKGEYIKSTEATQLAFEADPNQTDWAAVIVVVVEAKVAQVPAVLWNRPAKDETFVSDELPQPRVDMMTEFDASTEVIMDALGTPVSVEVARIETVNEADV